VGVVDERVVYLRLLPQTGDLCGTTVATASGAPGG